MITLTLLRRGFFPTCTLGELTWFDHRLKTLEPPWDDNRRNFSCIPCAYYLLDWFESTTKGRVLRLRDVPGRTYINIEVGNYPGDTRGCVLVGDSIHVGGDSDFMLFQSIVAMGVVRRSLGGETEMGLMVLNVGQPMQADQWLRLKAIDKPPSGVDLESL